MSKRKIRTKAARLRDTEISAVKQRLNMLVENGKLHNNGLGWIARGRELNLKGTSALETADKRVKDLGYDPKTLWGEFDRTVEELKAYLDMLENPEGETEVEAS